MMMPRILGLYKNNNRSKKCHVFIDHDGNKDLCGVITHMDIGYFSNFEEMYQFLETAPIKLCKDCRNMITMLELAE